MPTITNIIGINILKPNDLIVSIKDVVVPVWKSIIPIPIMKNSKPIYAPKISILNLSK